MLVARVLQGEHTAFAELVKQYSSLMLRVASLILGDRDVAEDAVQDALIKAWQHLPGLCASGVFRSWLMRIVVNQCNSFTRKGARSAAFVRQTIIEQATNLMAQGADDGKGRMERDRDVAQAIEQMPAKLQVVIRLHYYHGMTMPSMAQALHLAEITLRKRLRVALSNLRRGLCTNERDETFSLMPFYCSLCKEKSNVTTDHTTARSKELSARPVPFIISYVRT